MVVGLRGNHNLWHADDEIGMTVVGKDGRYGHVLLSRKRVDTEDFKEVFTAM